MKGWPHTDSLPSKSINFIWPHLINILDIFTLGSRAWLEDKLEFETIISNANFSFSFSFKFFLAHSQDLKSLFCTTSSVYLKVATHFSSTLHIYSWIYHKYVTVIISENFFRKLVVASNVQITFWLMSKHTETQKIKRHKKNNHSLEHKKKIKKQARCKEERSYSDVEINFDEILSRGQDQDLNFLQLSSCKDFVLKGIPKTSSYDTRIRTPIRVKAFNGIQCGHKLHQLDEHIFTFNVSCIHASQQNHNGKVGHIRNYNILEGLLKKKNK